MRRALLLFVLLALIAPSARAVEMSLSAVALHLPDSNYHYFASSLRARFGSDPQSAFFVEAGMTPPSVATAIPKR